MEKTPEKLRFSGGPEFSEGFSIGLLWQDMGTFSAISGNINISDFSLHSIGVTLFRHDKEDIFQEFVADIIPNTKLLSLPMELYRAVTNARKTLILDFNDAYQYSIAKHYGLKVVTMDRHFERIKDLDILFL